jgi:hypothetical protein
MKRAAVSRRILSRLSLGRQSRGANSDQVRIFKIRGPEDLSQHIKLNEL